MDSDYVYSGSDSNDSNDSDSDIDGDNNKNSDNSNSNSGGDINDKTEEIQDIIEMQNQKDSDGARDWESADNGVEGATTTSFTHDTSPLSSISNLSLTPTHGVRTLF